MKEKKSKTEAAPTESSQENDPEIAGLLPQLQPSNPKTSLSENPNFSAAPSTKPATISRNKQSVSFSLDFSFSRCNFREIDRSKSEKRSSSKRIGESEAEIGNLLQKQQQQVSNLKANSIVKLLGNPNLSNGVLLPPLLLLRSPRNSAAIFPAAENCCRFILSPLPFSDALVQS